MQPFKIDRTIYKGRPKSEGRLDKEMRVYDLLEKLNIDYERIDHDPTMSVDSCGEVEKILDIKICKNLFLCNSQKTKFYILMMIGDKKFKSGEVSKQVGSSRLSFASPEYMEKFLDITPGSVSVLGLMNDIHNNVQLIVDKDVLAGDYIGCHPCINTSSLKISTRDIFEKFIPYVKNEVIYVEI